MKYVHRTRFGRDIIAEFIPSRLATGNSQFAHLRQSSRPAKIAIVCDGMPVVPTKRNLLEFLSQKGYWVFHPRYRGTWESGGQFLARSPHEDVLLVLREIRKGRVTDLRTRGVYHFTPQEAHLFGTSFGGTAVMLASGHPLVTKAIALSPVIDWRVKSRAEPLPWLDAFIRSAFGNGYRYRRRDWRRLGEGRIFNPATQPALIAAQKILMFQAKDDRVVPWRPAFRFAKRHGVTLVLTKKGGHATSTLFMKPRIYKKVRIFLKRTL